MDGYVYRECDIESSDYCLPPVSYQRSMSVSFRHAHYLSLTFNKSSSNSDREVSLTLIKNFFKTKTHSFF